MPGDYLAKALSNDEIRALQGRLTDCNSRYRILADYSPDWEYWLGPDRRFIYVSPACEAICGYPPQAFLDDPKLFCRLLHPDDHDAWHTHLDEIASSDESMHENMLLRLFDTAGNLIWLEHQCLLVIDEAGVYQGRRGVNRNVTQRVRAEMETRHVTRLLKVLSEVNQHITREQNESNLIEEICRISVDIGGLKTSQVSFIDAVNNQLVPIAAAGISVDLPDGGWPLLLDDHLVLGDGSVQVLEHPIACAVVVHQQTPDLIDKDLHAWNQWLKKHGIGGYIHFRLWRGERCIGLISFFAEQADFLRDDVCALLKELAGDLSYALESYNNRHAEFEARFKLEHREAHLRTLMQTVPLGIGLVVAREFAEVNQAVCCMLGYSAEELIGRSARMIYPDDAEYDRVGREIYAQIAETGTGRIETRWRHKDGHVIEVNLISSAFNRNELGRGVVFTAEDISARKQAERQLDFLSHHDILTQLPNRDLLRDRLQHGIQRQLRDGKQLAVLSLDLDRFKNINESLGHRIGDQLLQVLAARLQEQMRGGDTLARVGGDEFVLLLENDVSVLAASLVARKLLALLSQPICIGETSLCVTASIGISFFPADGETPDDLLRHADVAMYKAKQQGRNAYQFFEAEMTADAFEHLLMENALRGAVDRNELRVHYQPQVDMFSGELLGLEALVRWQHAELGQVAPGRFIPLAEEAGLIGMIGEWVLREACQQMMRWDHLGFIVPRISVNLSVQQIDRETLLPLVYGVLKATGLSSDRLELEVTESMLMRQADKACGVLEALREDGVKLAIDDFGTGYSSLAYLNNMPMHRLKIDQSFVRDIGQGGNGEAIIRAIIALARSLGLEMVAEGIEEQAQAEFLKRESCRIGQGYLFCRPVDADEIYARWKGRGGNAISQIS